METCVFEYRLVGVDTSNLLYRFKGTYQEFLKHVQGKQYQVVYVTLEINNPKINHERNLH